MAFSRKTHLRENIEAIYLALRLERDSKQASPDEKEVLSQYSGFGGIKAILKDGFELTQNRFFVRGEGGFAYSYNHGHLAADPETASLNFLNALQTQPHKLLKKYREDHAEITADIPILKNMAESAWRKKLKLKALREELSSLDRQIQLSLKENEEVQTPDQEESVPEAVAAESLP